MGDLFKLIWYAVAGLFRSRAALQTEVLALRHQLNVLRRRAPKRVTVSNIDRLVFAGRIQTNLTGELDRANAKAQGKTIEQITETMLASIPAGRYGRVEGA
jgi:hypothetical protein